MLPESDGSENINGHETGLERGMSLQSIREVLQRHGPMTAEQIGTRIDLGPSSVSLQLKTLRERKEVHICEWIPLSKGGPGRNRAVFALGDAPDVVDVPRGKRTRAKQVWVKPVIAARPAQPDCGMWSGLIT